MGWFETFTKYEVGKGNIQGKDAADAVVRITIPVPCDDDFRQICGVVLRRPLTNYVRVGPDPL
jgi:hypothetical protein